MENKPIWHYRSPTTQEYQLAIKEIRKSDLCVINFQISYIINQKKNKNYVFL